MSRLDPRLLLQGYAAGIFPMADSRDASDLFWVEPRSRAIIPLDKFHMSRSLRRRSWRAGHLGSRSSTTTRGPCSVTWKVQPFSANASSRLAASRLGATVVHDSTQLDGVFPQPEPG